MPINRKAVSKHVKDQRYMISLEKSEDTPVKSPNSKFQPQIQHHVQQPHAQQTPNHPTIIGRSSPKVKTRTITYEIHNDSRNSIDNKDTSCIKNQNQTPRVRSQTAGNPNRPPMIGDSNRSATLGPLPRSPLLHKKLISTDDMEKELQRMYGSLPRTNTNSGLTVPKHDGHSQFCACRAKGCHSR